MTERPMPPRRHTPGEGEVPPNPGADDPHDPPPDNPSGVAAAGLPDPRALSS